MTKNNFAKNFGVLLKQNGLSQEMFGKVIGKGRSVVGSYIRGESEPDLDVLIGIADYFGTSLQTLLIGDVSSEHLDTLKPSETHNKVNEQESAYKTVEDLEQLKLLKSLFGVSLDEKINEKLDVLLERIGDMSRLDADVKALKEKVQRLEKH
ncbi:helix-turn-helix domain-containing protein [Winogradskyella sp.]|uniref:helix-turn-helix domain-containing protein n=1 Tax=Winogradskyella sp. TaxID=1883156 RepID=UPI003BAC9BAD